MRIELRNKTLGWGLVLVTGLLTLSVDLFLGIEVAVLTLAGGVLVLVIFVLWNSLLNLTGESPLTLEEAMSLAAPTAEEEQKRAVLRTLKDLEYERSVGKISEEDYHALSKSYREQAKALIRAADEGIASGRGKAERLLERRLETAASTRKRKKAVKKPVARPQPGFDAEANSASKPASDVRRTCADCGAKNDLDAKFCKKCGVALEVEA